MVVALAPGSGQTQVLRYARPESRNKKTRRPAPRTNPAPWRFQMASVTSQFEVQGAESAPFAAGFEAFPLRVGVLDLVESIRWGSARRFWGDSLGGACPVLGSEPIPSVSAPQSPATKPTRRPASRTNPAPWRFSMARVTSQIDVQGAYSAPFAAGFEALSLRVGVADLVESIRWGSARRLAGDSGGGTASDSGLGRRSCGTRARVRDLKDAPAGEENESSTLAFPNGEQGFPI